MMVVIGGGAGAGDGFEVVETTITMMVLAIQVSENFSVDIEIFLFLCNRKSMSISRATSMWSWRLLTMIILSFVDKQDRHSCVPLNSITNDVLIKERKGDVVGHQVDVINREWWWKKREKEKRMNQIDKMNNI